MTRSSPPSHGEPPAGDSVPAPAPATDAVGEPDAANAGQLEAVEETQPRYVHPDAAALFRCAPFLRYVPAFGPATEAFGYKCVLSLGLCYLLCKGIADQILSYARYAMFVRRFGVEASTYQRLAGISTMGWSIKALTAVFTDSLALFGYTKRWYMAASCVVGAACALVYGLLPATPGSASGAAGLIFVTSFCIANVDVLSEGHYSRLIKRSPKPGADLITWIWGFIMLGAIIASSIQGPISDAGKPQIGVFISAALQFVCVFIFIFNLYGEETNRVLRAEDHAAFVELMRNAEPAAEQRLSSTGDVDENGDPVKPKSLEYTSNEPMAHGSEGNMVEYYGEPDTDARREELMEPPVIPSCCCNVWEYNREVVQRNTKVMAYGLLMAAGVVTMAVTTILGTMWQMMYACIAVSAVLCTTAFFCLPLTAAKANLFIYLHFATYLQLPGALDTFYMASPECAPDGPHFTQTFYSTVGGTIGNVGGLFGVFLFNMVLSRYSYRLTFIVTAIIYIVASFFDLILVERWNRPKVSDHAIYILGDAIVYHVCYMLNFMPANILISRLCPKGSETTMYAILAGFANLGQSASMIIGSTLMETHFPVKSSVPCDFSNVRWLVIIGHMCAPLLCLPTVFVLIPSARVCDNLPSSVVDAPPLELRSVLRGLAFWRRKEQPAETESVDRF